MAEGRNNKTGYSIPRSFKPVVLQTVTVVALSDILLLAALLTTVGIRNALGLDAQLIGITVLFLGLKMVITTYGVFNMIRSWLGVSYFVVNNQLHVHSDIRSKSSEVYPLKDLAKASASTAYRMASAQNYGNVEIVFSRGAAVDSFTLHGVIDPELIARQLSKKA